MKRLLTALALAGALLVAVAVSRGTSGSGLKGTVLLDPAYPHCQVGTPCTRPAANVRLRFWRNGRVVAHVRTDSKGRFRIALAPRRYRVTSKAGSVLKPARVTVATGRYRTVTFRLDTGIR